MIYNVVSMSLALLVEQGLASSFNFKRALPYEKNVKLLQQAHFIFSSSDSSQVLSLKMYLSIFFEFQRVQVEGSGALLGAHCRSNADCKITHGQCDRGVCACQPYYARVNNSTCMECKSNFSLFDKMLIHSTVIKITYAHVCNVKVKICY